MLHLCVCKSFIWLAPHWSQNIKYIERQTWQIENVWINFWINFWEYFGPKMKYLRAKPHSPLAKRNSVYLPDRAHSVLASMSSDRICMAQGSLTQWIIGCVTNTMTCTGHGTTIESKSRNLSVAVLWLTYESCQVRVSKLPWTLSLLKKDAKSSVETPFWTSLSLIVVYDCHYT